MSRTSPSILRRERGLGEPRPDRRGDVRRGRALRHFLHRTVGKRDLEHLGHVRAACSERRSPPQPRPTGPLAKRLNSIAASRRLGGWGLHGRNDVGAGRGDDRAIRFTGTWREYLPIAATNALLIICTLGIYRFWAAARQRRYLWSRTEVIDDTLEWTGTGKEMFLGFLIVICVLAPFFLFIQFLFPGAGRAREGRRRVRHFLPVLHRAHLSRRLRPLPGAALPAVAQLVARHPRRQRRSRLELRRRISRPLRAVGDDHVHHLPVGGDAPVELALERDELRPAASSGRTSTPKG